jgi:hypothetical protein
MTEGGSDHDYGKIKGVLLRSHLPPQASDFGMVLK